MAKVNDDAIIKKPKPNIRRQDATQNKGERNLRCDSSLKDEGALAPLAKGSWDKFQARFVGKRVVFKK